MLSAAILVAACSPTAAEPTTTSLIPVTTTTSAPPSPIPAAVPRAVDVDPGDAAPPLPEQPAGTPFPDTDFPEGDLPSDVDDVALTAAIDRAIGDGTGAHARAVVIVHAGRIVAERYAAGDDADTVMPSFSVSKSVASAALGIMVGDGLLDPAQAAPVDQWQDPADPRSSITIDDLLRMSGGLAWREQDDRGLDLLALLAADDPVAYAVSKPLEATPGTTFTYSTGTTSILAQIMEDAAGGPDALVSLLESRLFAPIGMEPIELRTDETGTWLAGYSADTTARGFARFGLLILRDGVWDGVRILPPGWVDRMRTPTPAEPGYGAHWRLDIERPGVMIARGLRGQLIAVDPRHDLVVVVLSTDRPTSDDLLRAVFGAFD